MTVWLFLRVSAFSARGLAVGLFFGSGFAGLDTDFQFLLMAERNFQQPFSHGGTEERQKTEIWFWLFLREQLAVGYFDLVFSLRASVSP